ncbi:MAG: hypothetical protein V3U71_06255 [Cocleimonas sp.]
MRIVLKSNNKKLPIIFFMIFPGLCLANEFLGQNLKQQEINAVSHGYQGFENNLDILNLINHYVDDVVNISSNRNSKSNPLPKGKPELEKILGSWIVSYSIGSETLTDRLDINEVRSIDDASDLDYLALGKIFQNGSGDGQTMRCAELTPDLVSHFAFDYMCRTVDSQHLIKTYIVGISEDNVISGYYGQGTTLEDAALVSLSKTIALTGHREKNNEQSAHFDEGTGELVIPRVSYKNSKFRVVLQDMGGLVFSVKEAKPIDDGNTSGSYFDKFSGELAIPNVTYRDSKFKVILQDTGNFIFSVKEASPLL